MWVQSVGWEDLLGEGMTTYSSILAAKSHEQRRLVGYSPWDHRESDKTELTQRAHKLNEIFNGTKLSPYLINCRICKIKIKVTIFTEIQFSSVHSLSRVRLFVAT